MSSITTNFFKFFLKDFSGGEAADAAVEGDCRWRPFAANKRQKTLPQGEGGAAGRPQICRSREYLFYKVRVPALSGVQGSRSCLWRATGKAASRAASPRLDVPPGSMYQKVVGA